MVQNKNYNLILMDLTMPVMDGITSALKIREYEKSSELKPVPIIALTAHAYPEDRERCKEAGMDGYLAKPFQPADLMKEIDRVVNTNNNNTPD
jgi:CheY-like chemotaxis protein